MNILIACEFSGIVRDAFIRRGHNAISCDLLPTEAPGPHIEGDVLDLLGCGWDLMIAHPPCTHLAVSGARYFPEKRADGRQQAALDFVRRLMEAPIPRVCIENPVSVISSAIRRPDQIIQPWMFGHAETKATCLWLKGLPKLTPTEVVEPQYIVDAKGVRYSPMHYNTFRLKPKERGHARSKTYSGIAEAMAAQWGESLASLDESR